MTDVIKIAQSVLAQRGFYSGEIDGLAGELTLKAVLVAIGPKYNLPNDPARAEEYCIMFIQDYAATLGFNAGPVDGWYGQRTADAVVEIEAMMGGRRRRGGVDYQAMISGANIADAASKYDLDPALIRAALSVESRGRGFIRLGVPKILFEGHVFWRQLKEIGLDPVVIAPTLPQGVLYPKWVRKWYVGGEGEYKRLDAAEKVNRSAALKSASWGLFQIMGFNFELAGYRSVLDFVKAMVNGGERAHLNAYLCFITSTGAIDKLRKRDFAGYARIYNGRGYKKLGYDKKMKAAYGRYTS